MFGLDVGIGDFFQTAFKFVKLGSQVLTEEENQDSRGFVDKKRFNFDSSIPTPQARLREMEAPIGMRQPNIQAAARFFANNQARDTNINSIKAERFRPARTRKLASTAPNIGVSYNASPTVSSARTARVNRSTFRSRM